MTKPASPIGRTWVFIVLYLTFCGCGGFTVHLPPELSDAEEKYYNNIECDRLLYIKEHKRKAYSEDLYKTLRKTKCKNSFEYDAIRPVADIAIEIDEEVYGPSIIPFWWIVSFGIIPCYGKANYGFKLKLTRPDGSVAMLDCSGATESGLGWIPLFYNFSEDWAMRNINGDERYYKRLLISIDKAIRSGSTESQDHFIDPSAAAAYAH